MNEVAETGENNLAENKELSQYLEEEEATSVPNT